MTSDPVLETERLILRRLTPADAEALYRIYHEPDVLKYFAQGPPESIEAERAGIVRHLGYYDRYGFGLWATVWRDTGELIGRCGLLAQQVDGVDEVEVAYLLSPRFWGRRLASEAARAIRDFGFQRLGQPRLISVIHPQNLASKRGCHVHGDATFQSQPTLRDGCRYLYDEWSNSRCDRITGVNATSRRAVGMRVDRRCSF